MRKDLNDTGEPSETTEKVGKKILRARIDWDCRVAGAPRNINRGR